MATATTATSTRSLVPVYRSGQKVDPGVYIDMESGAAITVYERDTLPDGMMVVRYARRFRRISGLETNEEETR